MFKIPVWIIVIVILNIAIFLIGFRPNPNADLSLTPQQSPVNKTVKTQNVTQSVTNAAKNTTKANQTVNVSIYTSKCVNSIGEYRKNLSNITGFKFIETLYFNDTDEAVNYIQEHSNNSFELIGVGKDVFALNKSVISLSQINASGNSSVTIPIVCNENGTIGSYSRCALSNITDITYLCHNLTEDATECELERLNFGYWDDILYWITPKPGNLSVSQSFNFTITSSRNRIEYAFLTVDYYNRTSMTFKNLFNQSKTTLKGDKLSITTTKALNMTGKTFGGLTLNAYFKKKCYKYDMVVEYKY